MLKWLENVISGKSSVPASKDSLLPERSKGGTLGEPPLPDPVLHLDQAVPDEIFGHGILSRHVIVDRAYHPVAYEFGLRAESTHRGITTAQILAGVLGKLGETDVRGGRQMWLRMHDKEIVDALPKSLDPANTVLAIEVTESDSASMNAALEQARLLKTEGFHLALADWHDTERHQAWLPLCAYVEVRNTSHNPVDLAGWVERLGALSPEAQLVACDVDSWEELEYCHRIGFHFFRGHFLTHRENWPRQPKFSPERARLVDLLNRLHTGAELNEVADQLKQSPELSYRLLRYINSAGIGSSARIGSIQQGLMVLGRDKIYRWLTVLLFTSNHGKSLDSALLEQALVRARLMELLAGDRFNRVQVDEIFIVGIFSLLDMLLRLPMSVALEPLKLPKAVELALLDCNSADSEYAPYLGLALSCEEGERDRLRALASQLSIPLPIINSLHLDALVWTQRTLMEN